ncbi:MAG TPA: polyketide synthase dehydratase domain-containing protein [Smithellaceae bacterium]|nr:polyketide synthase dehydratase domain-containing protein [Smithellaceae bacterium]
MENISRLASFRRYPWVIKIYPYLYDHSLDGKAVFPAAEALITLARAVKTYFPQADIVRMTEAAFPRFLPIPVRAEALEAFVDLAAGNAGEIEAALLTKTGLPEGNIVRTVVHARVKFSRNNGRQLPECSLFHADKPEGECIDVPAAAVYRELVPFGAAFRNISGVLSVSRAGALARLSGGAAEADEELLGSPFPFDAVMHAACVWAQRFTGIVPFPVGFAQRIVYKRTKKQMVYLGRIVPVAAHGALNFSAVISDSQGGICEAIQGIQMQDVSRGRKKPPDWIRERNL